MTDTTTGHVIERGEYYNLGEDFADQHAIYSTDGFEGVIVIEGGPVDPRLLALLAAAPAMLAALEAAVLVVAARLDASRGHDTELCELRAQILDAIILATEGT
jgi:hypothetical protein